MLRHEEEYPMVFTSVSPLNFYNGDSSEVLDEVASVRWNAHSGTNVTTIFHQTLPSFRNRHNTSMFVLLKRSVSFS